MGTGTWYYDGTHGIRSNLGTSGIMQTYVAEVDGRAVIAFRAADDDHAQTWVEDEEKIRSELLAIENDRKPLWDRAATLSIRPANMEECLEE
jgi:hypothetical protein